MSDQSKTRHQTADEGGQPDASPKQTSAKDARAQRLSQALRDNLRRRKTQTRQRKAASSMDNGSNEL